MLWSKEGGGGVSQLPGEIRFKKKAHRSPGKDRRQDYRLPPTAQSNPSEKTKNQRTTRPRQQRSSRSKGPFRKQRRWERTSKKIKALGTCRLEHGEHGKSSPPGYKGWGRREPRERGADWGTTVSVKGRYPAKEERDLGGNGSAGLK